MKRRTFLKKAGLATAASLVLPTILPTGRLFAATGSRKVNHVVFCLFAGGVRNLESMQKIDGNLMPYTIPGSEAISSDIQGGMSPLPAISGLPLVNSGTLFKEFRYKDGPTSHFSAHATAVTGRYITNDIKLRQPPPYPTIFEYYRKHNSPSKTAKNAWWISSGLGPYPYLNYSDYPGYGPLYGANSLQPGAMFNFHVNSHLGNPKEFHPEEYETAGDVRDFLNNQFGSAVEQDLSSMRNDEEDLFEIQDFIKTNMNEAASGAHYNPWGLSTGMNNDMYNIFYTNRIIEAFKPELTVVSIQNIDVCHTNFTSYCDAIRKADFALSKLWEKIQSTPGMANDTVLIAAPEHGRNLDPNTLIDQFGRAALDHTGNGMSREIFCLMLGPSGIVQQNQMISTEVGESIDIVPTIANLLGFDNEIPSGLLPGSVLQQALVS